MNAAMAFARMIVVDCRLVQAIQQSTITLLRIIMAVGMAWITAALYVPDAIRPRHGNKHRSLRSLVGLSSNEPTSKSQADSESQTATNTTGKANAMKEYEYWILGAKGKQRLFANDRAEAFRNIWNEAKREIEDLRPQDIVVKRK